MSAYACRVIALNLGRPMAAGLFVNQHRPAKREALLRDRHSVVVEGLREIHHRLQDR